MDQRRGVTSRLTFDPHTRTSPCGRPTDFASYIQATGPVQYDLYIKSATGAGTGRSSHQARHSHRLGDELVAGRTFRNVSSSGNEDGTMICGSLHNLAIESRSHICRCNSMRARVISRLTGAGWHMSRTSPAATKSTCRRFLFPAQSFRSQPAVAPSPLGGRTAWSCFIWRRTGT